MYIQVLQPVAQKGSKPIPVNPDALASVLAGTDAAPLQQPGSGLSGYIQSVRGLGCAGDCHCGGKCGGHGMGQADPATASLLAQMINSESDMGLATWLLVGLSGFGMWWIFNQSREGIRTHLKRKRIKRAAHDKERFTGRAFGDVL